MISLENPLPFYFWSLKTTFFHRQPFQVLWKAHDQVTAPEKFASCAKNEYAVMQLHIA